tara:strand:- start:254 stop:1108 length:855 start_codon:yes stop_codon:yes gene_type:complete
MVKTKFLFFCCLILSLISFAEEKENPSLKILVYNTHGLPEIFIDDNPKFRFPIIGKKTQSYDISLLQEDYAHHTELQAGLSNDSLALRGVSGNTFSCPFCTGSGLTSVFNLPDDWKVEVKNEAYKTCSGWLRGANDCFAYKGFQVIKISLPEHEEIYLVNTHMDAGRRDSDRASRAIQLKHIISSIENLEGKALVVAGDLNLKSTSQKDMALLDSFKDTLNLYDSFSETEINEKWSILDYILYRPGENINFEILTVGEDESFKTHEGALSDHPALFIEFEIIKN